MTATASRLGAIATLVGLGLLIAACDARASGTPGGSAAPTAAVSSPAGPTGAVSSPAALVTAPPPPASVTAPEPSTATSPSAGPTRSAATPDLRPIDGLLGQLDAALGSADAAAVQEGSAP